jgi:hypothetical protein
MSDYGKAMDIKKLSTRNIKEEQIKLLIEWVNNNE